MGDAHFWLRDSYDHNTYDNTYINYQMYFSRYVMGEMQRNQPRCSYIFKGRKVLTIEEETSIISPIVGTWDFSEKNGSYYLTEQWIFNVDGSFVYNIEEGGIFLAGQGLLPPTNKQLTGTWHFSNSTNDLILITDSDTYAWKAYIQGNNMTIDNSYGTTNGPYNKR